MKKKTIIIHAIFLTTMAAGALTSQAVAFYHPYYLALTVIVVATINLLSIPLYYWLIPCKRFIIPYLILLTALFVSAITQGFSTYFPLYPSTALLLLLSIIFYSKFHPLPSDKG